VTTKTKTYDNLVPRNMQGQTYATCRFEVLVWDSQSDYDQDQTEAKVRKRVVAKFTTYGDALFYAHDLAKGGLYYKVIVRA
jgi:hypothetical protein